MPRTARSAAPEVQIRLKRGRQIVLGPGRVELLERVARIGSISAAAREMKMSYRHAWLLLEYTREVIGAPVVETSQGGKRGGGAKLTPAGKRVVSAYRRIERKARTAVRSEIAKIFEPNRRKRHE